MQPLGAAVDVHQQQIVQKEVLDEIVLVQALLVGRHQALDLEGRQLADYIGVLPGPGGHQHILQNLVIEYLKELISLYLLGIRHRCGKFRNGFRNCGRPAAHVGSRGHLLAVHIHNTKFDPSNVLQSIDCVL